MKTTLTCLLLLAIVGIAPVASAAVLSAGLAQPVGETGEVWRGGYNFGAELPVSRRHGIDWSVLLSASRLTPDGGDLLRTGGRSFRVERSKGESWNLELTLIGGKQLLCCGEERWGIRGFGGVGLFYIDDSEVFVSGFYPSGPSAINRHRTIAAQSLAGPGVTAGAAVRMFGAIEPQIRWQYIFIGETPRSMLQIGLGLLPQR